MTIKFRTSRICVLKTGMSILGYNLIVYMRCYKGLPHDIIFCTLLAFSGSESSAFLKKSTQQDVLLVFI